MYKRLVPLTHFSSACLIFFFFALFLSRSLLCQANAIVPTLQGSVLFAYNNSTDIGRRTPLLISDFVYDIHGSFSPGGFDAVIERDDDAQFSYPTIFQV